MSWNPAAIDAKLDALTNPQTDEATAKVDTPPVTDPPIPPVVVPTVAASPVEEPLVPVVTEVIPPVAEGTSSVTDDASYKTAVDAVGGLDELAIIGRISAPLLAPELDVNAVVDMLEQERGLANAEAFAMGMLNLYAADYATLLLRDPDRIVTDPVNTPEGQRQLAVRNEILAFREFRTSGASRQPASTRTDEPPIPAPIGTTAQPGQPAFTPINTEEWNLPPELEAQIKAANALAAQAVSLTDRVKKLETTNETEDQRRAREAGEEKARISNQRFDNFIDFVCQPADDALKEMKFSTNPDPAEAKREDDEQRRQIALVLNHDLRSTREEVILANGQKMTTAACWQKAEELHLKGDLLGARRYDAALRTKGRELALKHAQSPQRRMLDSIASDKAVANNNTPTRTQVSGQGTGASPVLPIPPTGAKPGRAWENVEGQLDARMARSNPAAPVG